MVKRCWSSGVNSAMANIHTFTFAFNLMVCYLISANATAAESILIASLFLVVAAVTCVFFTVMQCRLT